MCRWIAYAGNAVPMEELILKPEHSLVMQSLASKEGAEPTNGDGFGVGWYGDQKMPGLYKSIVPAWNDHNLESLGQHIRSRLFIAHVRATTGTPVQRTNCHPFTHGNWMFCHNGVIRGYEKVKRELTFAVDPSLYFNIDGTTDSEVMFYLALTFGLMDRPLEALEQMAGFVEDVGRQHGEPLPLQMSLGLSDGERIYAVRYSSEDASRSLYYSNETDAFRGITDDLDQFSSDARAVVSEPLGERIPNFYTRVPEASFLVVDRGKVDVRPFSPKHQ